MVVGVGRLRWGQSTVAQVEIVQTQIHMTGGTDGFDRHVASFLPVWFGLVSSAFLSTPVRMAVLDNTGTLRGKFVPDRGTQSRASEILPK
jgi:shikimate kinase